MQYSYQKTDTYKLFFGFSYEIVEHGTWEASSLEEAADQLDSAFPDSDIVVYGPWEIVKEKE